MMNKSTGNMYDFVTHTKNYIKGKCKHGCSYCYMGIFKLNDIKLDNRELQEDLGENNFIFVGSSTDMFADDVPKEWIVKSINHCKKYSKNRYLFQTKNPNFFVKNIELFEGMDYILATTIETNRFYKAFMGNTPHPKERAIAMSKITVQKMVTIEPILDFDKDMLVDLIRQCNPEWVNIGADSKNHNLIEPTMKQITDLKTDLEKFTTIKYKRNIGRLK